MLYTAFLLRGHTPYTEAQLVIADTLQNGIHQFSVIGLVLAGQFTGDDKLPAFQQTFNCHTAVFIMDKAISHNGVRNLIADFIRVTVANLLTGIDFTHIKVPLSKSSMYQSRHLLPLSTNLSSSMDAHNESFREFHNQSWQIKKNIIVLFSRYFA